MPLRSRRQQRALFVQKLQHVFPAAVLLAAGAQEFIGEPHGWGLALASVEIVVGLLMLGAIAKTAYGTRQSLLAASVFAPCGRSGSDRLTPTP